MQTFDDVERAVDAALAKVGRRVRLAIPLGLGKPIPFVNALYRRAKADPGIELHIFTALTLERPKGKSELEQRFLGPFVERVYGDYPDLEYELDRVAGTLPPNVRVIEFYLYAGKYLRNSAVQRDYISTNYTRVARDLLARGVNVVAQQLCHGDIEGRAVLSLSCNPDVSFDLITGLRAGSAPSFVVGQINPALPFMHGDAVVMPDLFDALVDAPSDYHRLFSTPKTAIADDEQMIGLYASTLIRDGGTLQIGIGAIGDALVYALELRHEHNAVYREVLEKLGVLERFGDAIARIGGLGPFEKGLFASTEMLVDGFMHLIEAGIVKRKVYDFVALQKLLNEGKIGERVSARTLEALMHAGAVGAVLGTRELGLLQHFGVLRHELRLDQDALVFPDGTRVAARLDDPTTLQALMRQGLGSTLQNGALVHAGFFLGPESFYQWLRELPEARRREIRMRSISRTNQLYGHETLNRLQRRDARFVNTAMMVTLSGAVVSDALEDGHVVSGVGGQYNFVAMADALHDAHSVLQVRSTRTTSSGEVVSSVLYNYGHTTIPRHLRDVIVTDHGIAELRAKTDGEVVEALLAVTDSRFQPALLERAQREGKLAPEHTLPEAHRANTPERYRAVLAEYRARGFFPAYPFGSDLTEHERVLARALRALAQKIESSGGKLEALAGAVLEGRPHVDAMPYLERMGLAEPTSLRETLYQRLISAELRQLGIGADDT